MASLSTVGIFTWAFLGSFAWAVVSVDQYYEREDCLPSKIRSLPYWINRIALAIFAGLMAVALTADSPTHALYVGVTAPVLITAWRSQAERGQGLW